MRVCFTVRLWAAVFCGLLLCAALPVSAFDEDHKEVINGAMLHFRVRGTDKAHPYLVILHGGPGFSSHMFYTWGPSLEKSMNVVYLDQRGCGESARLSVADVMNPKPSEIKGYTFSTLIADIEGVRQFLKVDKWAVLGHSYGGMLGVEYVAAHPEHVTDYIHMDGLVSVPQMQNAVLDNAAKKFAAATPKDETDLAAVTQLRALPLDNPARMFGGFGLAMGPAGLYFAGDQKTEFAAFYGQLGTAIKPYGIPYTALAPASEPGAALIANDQFLTRDDTPLLAKISVPTLIINGKQDGVITPQSAETAHTAIKNSQIVELDSCGHFPFFEQPEKTTAAILAFVGLKQAAAFSQEASPIGDFAPLRLSGSVEGPLSSSRVTVGYTISTTGQAVQMYLTHSSGSGILDQACINAIKDTKFRPALREGVPIAQKATHDFIIAGN